MTYLVCGIVFLWLMSKVSVRVVKGYRKKKMRELKLAVEANRLPSSVPLFQNWEEEPAPALAEENLKRRKRPNRRRKAQKLRALKRMEHAKSFHQILMGEET